MTINVPIRELTRLRSLQDKVGQILGRDKLDATLKNDLSKLYDSLSYGAKKLEDLNNKNIPLE